MTNLETALADYEQQHAVRVAEAENKISRLKSATLPILAAHGVALVELAFDGCSDSGCIEEMTCLDPANQMAACPEIAVSIDGVSDRPLAEGLEDLAYTALELHHPGWEVNDGAMGKLQIDVSTGRFTLECHQRFTDYDSYSTEL